MPLVSKGRATVGHELPKQMNTVGKILSLDFSSKATATTKSIRLLVARRRRGNKDVFGYVQYLVQ